MNDPITNLPAPEGCPAPTGSGWVDAATKPRTGRKVIVCGIYRNGNRWRAMASWQPKGTVDTNFWDETPDDWEEDENGEVTNPYDLWLEESVELETVGFLENVTHWMECPEMPPHPYAQNTYSGTDVP